MKTKILTLVALAVLPAMIPANAQAREVCREYSKTIRIDGKLEIGYGTACRTSDRTWEIVKLSGRDHARSGVRDRIYDDLYSSGFRIVLFDNDYKERRYKRSRNGRGYRNVVYYSPSKYSKNYKYKKRYR